MGRGVYRSAGMQEKPGDFESDYLGKKTKSHPVGIIIIQRDTQITRPVFDTRSIDPLDRETREAPRVRCIRLPMEGKLRKKNSIRYMPKLGGCWGDDDHWILRILRVTENLCQHVHYFEASSTLSRDFFESGRTFFRIILGH